MTSSTVSTALSALALAMVCAATASCSRNAATSAPAASAARAVPVAGAQLQGETASTPGLSSAPLLPTREQLKAHRLAQIERLQAYADAGVFPRNFPDVNHVHMFKDPDDHFCAVANLIHQDGRDDVVDRVAFEDNGFEVATEDDTEVDAWIRTSGLTREEVARIQAPAMPIDSKYLDLTFDDSRVAARPKKKTAPAVAARPTEVDMVKALRERIATVKLELVANTDASLDQAMNRLAEAPL